MQGHMIAAIAEFIGTFMFLFLAFAGHLMAISQSRPLANETQSNQTVVIIALAYAISLLVNVWAFYRIGSGVFNPAVRPSPSVFTLRHLSNAVLSYR
jgi:aquaporin related protein